MKYFLDHPKIKRSKALGTGSTPKKGLEKSVEKLNELHKEDHSHMGGKEKKKKGNPEY